VDIAAWLRQLGLERYEQRFRDSDIDTDILADLNETDLEGLGLSLGHRKKLLKAIAALGPQERSGAVEPSVGRLAAQPPAVVPKSQAERRQLTILFCDLTGATELVTGRDPEDMRGVIHAYQQCCRSVIGRWDGHVAKSTGSRVLVCFGWPRAHEGDAERAVHAGLELVGAVGRLTAYGASLAARVGIATGLVMIGDLIGQGAAKEEAVVGETPNLAARLEALAAPGSVVIGQATRQLVGGLFALTDLGPQRLKGFAEPLGAWRVEGAGRAEGRFDALHGERLTPLVGREHELGILLERWAWATRDGDGQTVLLAGEPGIGKSRLIRSLIERLPAEPHARLRYYCSPHHSNSALFPLIDQLERAAGFRPDDTAEAKLERLEAVLAEASENLAEAVPLLAALLSIPAAPRYRPLDLMPEARKLATFDALLGQIVGLAERRPLLMVLEDAHWIDPTSSELFELIVDRIQHLPVLLLITYRSEFTPPRTGRTHVTSLTLSRLGQRQGAQMVERLTGGKPLPAEVLRQILLKTDGVPLFVEELTKTVLESDWLRDAGDRYELAAPLPPLAIPTTLQGSLMARLDRLVPVKDLAQIGAVIGREFSHELLAAVADRPEAELQGALDQLVSSELVFRRGSPAATTYSFKHALVQDAAYQSLLKSRRQRLHARIAAVLEGRFGDKAQREPELLAHHHREAGRRESAIPYATAAGDVAFGRFAFVEARVRYQEAVDMAQALPPSEQARHLQLQAMLKLAHIYQLLGEFGHMPANEAYPKAKSAAMQALELDPANAEAHYVLAMILGLFDWDWAGSERAYIRALELDPDHVRAHQHYGIFLLTPLGRHDHAVSELERAVELDPLISWTEVDLAGALIRAGRPDQASARLSSVIERDPTFPHAHRQLGLARAQLGDHEQAIAGLQKTVELTRGEAFATAQLGWAYAVAGKTDDAEVLLDQLNSRAAREHVDPLAFAWLNIGLGNTEAAFFWLERAYEAKSSWLIFLKVQQIYEPLHADPRYHDLLRRLGLAS
jgi:class 3 adenylate cyclase/tetratricopeptide (TPR) repeat protein